MFKNLIIPFIAISLSIILGIVIAIFVPNIRYTHYVEPVRVDLTPTKAYQEMLISGSGNYLFFDVRSRKEYDELHASGSVSVPIADLYNLWENDLPRSKDKQIYLICTSGRLAAVAYDFLAYHGYTNIKHIQGGINQWIVESQPVVAKDIFAN